jgi:hypothetical protein
MLHSGVQSGGRFRLESIASGGAASTFARVPGYEHGADNAVANETRQN